MTVALSQVQTALLGYAGLLTDHSFIFLFFLLAFLLCHVRLVRFLCKLITVVRRHSCCSDYLSSLGNAGV